MTIENKQDSTTESNKEERIGSDVTDRYIDIGSLKSFGNTDSQGSLSPMSSDTKLDISQNSESEKSDDTPDSSPPVYKSTTELIEPDYKHLQDCCCCCCPKIKSSWKQFKNSFSEFTSRQWRMLIALCLGALTSSLSVCLFPPFYPKLFRCPLASSSGGYRKTNPPEEDAGGHRNCCGNKLSIRAESKGESATMYGLVIGTNCLTAFIVTPIIGKNMEKIGVNFAFIAGTICSGFCCCLSGFLDYFPPGIKFKLMSVLIRIFHATSNAAVITSIIAFIASEFPYSVAFLFSLTRATMNLAQMFGPVLGGALHGLGGFKIPFFVLGTFQVFTSLICAFILPTFRGKPKNNKGEQKAIWSVVRIPGLWVSFVTFIFSTMSNGFLSITLEPRVLRQFCFSPLHVGLLFGLKDGANCFASPLWGWLCDRINRIKLLIVVGSILAGLSFILLGPFPGLPIHHTILIVILALVLNGFGVGAQQVAGVISAMKDTVDAGFPDEADTHAFVAGVWSSLSGIGRFTSRAGSGILVDTIGFRTTSAIVTSFHLFILLFTSCYLCFANETNKSDEEIKRKNYKINADATSPTEPLSSKSASVSVPVPVVREDLEDSFMIGSASSRVSKW